MVNIAFAVTPMSAPGSAALLILFRLSGTHHCCPTWGSVFVLVFRRGVCANAAVYFKVISLMTQPHRFLVSLHMYDTTHSCLDFFLSPVFTAVDFEIVAVHRDRLFVYSWFLQASSTSANNH